MRLAQRYSRSDRLVRTNIVVLVAAGLVAAQFALFSSLTLSRSQVMARDWGRFGAFATLDVSVPPGDDLVVRKLTANLERAVASDWAVLLFSYDIQLATLNAPSVAYREARWRERPFPDRYGLVSGRWPETAGEVVVAENLDLEAKGTQLRLLGDRTTLTVVGQVDDRFSRLPTILAAPGTWRGLDPTLAADFPLSAQPAIYWDGTDPAGLALAVGAATASGPEARRTMAQAFLGSVFVRSQAQRQAGRSAFDSIPAGYTVPSLIVPTLAALLVLTLNMAWIRRRILTMRGVGIGRGAAVGSVLLALLGWASAAAIVGTGLGLTIGAVVGRLIVPVTGQPSGPMDGVYSLLARVLAGTAVTLCLAWIWISRSQSDGVAEQVVLKREDSRPRRGGDLRRLSAAAVGALVTIQVTRLDSSESAMILAGLFAVLILLLVPDLVPRVVERLPERSPWHRLAWRQLRLHRHRTVMLTAMLSALLGLSAGFLTLLTTMITTAGDQSYPSALPGQLIVADRVASVFAAPSRVLQVVNGVPGVADRGRFTLYSATAINSIGQPQRTAAFEGSSTLLLAVDTVRDASRLIGRRLQPHEVRALRQGGVLAWEDQATRSSGAVGSLQLLDEQEQVRASVRVPVATVALPRVGWRDGSGGLVLTKTAATDGIEVMQGPVVYTPLTLQEVNVARRTVARSGQDTRTLNWYAKPAAPVPPIALTVTNASLILLTIFFSSVLTGAQVRVLRAHSGSLIALGIPISRVWLVLLLQHALILTMSFLLAFIIAVVPVILAAARLQGWSLSVPWLDLGSQLLAVCVASGIALSLGIARIKPTTASTTS